MIDSSNSDPILPIATLFLFGVVFLICQADFKTMRIPDAYTAILLIAGLGFVIAINDTVPISNIVGSIVLGGIFWLMRIGYARLRGKPGLGFGDVKLASASSIWLSPWFLSTFLLIACSTCIVYVVVRGLISGRETLQQRIPFGPFLGIGLAATWVLEQYYLGVLL